MRNFVTTIAVLLSLSVAYTGLSDQAGQPDVTQTDIAQSIEGLRLRLNLTDDQTQEVLQLLQDYCAALRTILERHSVTAIVGDIRWKAIGGEPIYFMVDPGVFREMQAELRAVSTELEERLADILTPEQRTELRNIRDHLLSATTPDPPDPSPR